MNEVALALRLGQIVLEMADRVRVVDKVVPRSQAVWAFEMDDVKYRVVVTVDGGSRKTGEAPGDAGIRT